MTAICAGLIVAYAWMALPALKGRRGKGFRPRIDPFAAALGRPEVWKRIRPLSDKPRLALALLNGGSCTHERLVEWTAESAGNAYLVLTAAALLAGLTGTPGLLVLGALVGGCVPLLRAKELSGRVGRRKTSILMELPELLSKLLLMVNAGENVMKALAIAAEQKSGDSNPLYTELRAAIESMKRGDSLAVALEEMGRRCAVPEVKMFATTVLINARRGGDAFAPALRDLTRQMWEKRKALARTLGEQASSRLAFPLTLVFLIIMVLVGTPAVLMM